MAAFSDAKPDVSRGAALTVAYLGAAAILMLASLMVTEHAAVLLRGGAGALAVGGALVGARRNQRIGTNPWICIAAGVSLWVCGDVMTGLAQVGGHRPAHWTDLVTLLGYVAVGIGIIIIAKLRSDAPSRTAFLDASVLAIAVAMLIWVVLIASNHPASSTTVDRLILAAYPLADGVLVAILGWIILTPGRRASSLWLIGGGLALVLATNLVHDVGIKFDTDWSAMANVARPIALIILGLAGLRSTGELVQTTPRPSDSTENKVRLALLALALLVGPAVSILSDTSKTEGVNFVGVCSVLLAVGVIARFVNLVKENRDAHDATATSERRFRLLADSAPVGIFEFARGMRITYANSEGLELFPDAIGGTPDTMLDRIDEASQDRLNTAIQAVSEGRRGSAELRLGAGAGDRWVLWQGLPVRMQGAHLPAAFASTLDISQLKRAETALARQATHDPLTGLPNRRLLLDALIDALQLLGRGHRTGTVALMFIDLDQFKMVNDVLGHDAGDALLKTAAQRLRNAVREHDIVARFGGDEFVVLLQHVADRGELHDVARRILAALEVPIHVAGTEAKVGASVGIATATGPDDDPDALVRNADAAMYKAKEHGRGRYEFFRPDPATKTHRML